MSTKPSGRKPAPSARVRPAMHAGEVGYARPPRAHRFKPGESGNPKGRPKGSKNESTILHELLHRKIDVRQGGRTRKITVLEAILMRFTEDSLKGNTKSAAFLLNRYGTMVSGEPDGPEMSGDDREILEAFTQRLTKQIANKEVKS